MWWFFTILLVGAMIFGFVHISAKGRQNVVNKCIRIVNKHIDTLAIKRMQLIRIDSYGVADTSKWNEEVQYFMDKVLRPKLSRDEADILNGYGITVFAQEYIEKPAREINARMEANNEFSPSMSPEDYEKYCGRLLEKQGWSVRTTPVTGDQGADLVASKGNAVLVIQCKLYSSPVGNAAVQEVVAAQKHYSASHCAVVTNSTFTSSALALAASNGVHMLHHAQLGSIDQLVMGAVPA